MQAIPKSFDPETVEWCHVADPDFTEFKLDYAYCILGFDIPSGRLDMLLRFTGNGGHCMRHRHVASTATFILEGEQHLEQLMPDGSVKQIVRAKGTYALSGGDDLPHLERGGPDGCTILMSLHAPDGVLFEYMDKNMENRRLATIEDYVDRWNNGGVLPT